MADRYKIVIEGVDAEGHVFRPSNWAERVCGRLSTYHKRRIHYSPMLHPGSIDGHRCVLLDSALKERQPELYESILEFARDNGLQMHEEVDRVEREQASPLDQGCDTE